MKYSITNDTITIVADGVVTTLHQDSKAFASVREALFKGQFERAKQLASPAAGIKKWSRGHFKVVGGVIEYRGQKIPANLNDRILAMVDAGDDPKSLCKFWEKLKQNPSNRSVEQLFAFLQHTGIPVTDDGDILTYKSVRTDMKDHHTGTFSNEVGTINEMPRNEISDDPTLACHHGFHVGSLEYVRGFRAGSPIVICKVNPADVVCVPHDYSQQKVRVCRYEVVGEYEDELSSTYEPLSKFKKDNDLDDSDLDELNEEDGEWWSPSDDDSSSCDDCSCDEDEDEYDDTDEDADDDLEEDEDEDEDDDCSDEDYDEWDDEDEPYNALERLAQSNPLVARMNVLTRKDLENTQRDTLRRYARALEVNNMWHMTKAELISAILRQRKLLESTP